MSLRACPGCPSKGGGENPLFSSLPTDRDGAKGLERAVMAARRPLARLALR